MFSHLRLQGLLMLECYSVTRGKYKLQLNNHVTKLPHPAAVDESSHRSCPA